METLIVKVNQKINGILQDFVGKIKGNTIHAYWWQGEKNFGDLLNPAVLKHYGLTPISASRLDAEAIVIGSLLESQPENFSGYIIGAGLKRDVKRTFPNAEVLAVRGELTRERISAKPGTALGDPGLLVPLLYPKRSKKKFVLGIVPHFFDKQDARIQKICNQSKSEILFIDVQRSPQLVISEIDQCEFILSSSLHGVITADALGIPNAWILLSDKVQGKGFKFFDYASAIQREIQPNEITGDENVAELMKITSVANAKMIAETQQRLDIIFREFAEEIRSGNRLST